MDRTYVRKWEEVDVNEVTRHLLILGAVSCDCAQCRHLGIDYAQTYTCPNCQTPFKYITYRRETADSHGRFSIIRRIRARRPDLIIVDYLDYKDQTGKHRAKDLLFKNMPEEKEE
ncbi:MAG: hypothetical protein JW844_02420 [Candidatus Omnitrophica bacterium]|nr:hypothetical protein [Candidatus Omnitrophota bacterium]